jgi:hypothetical protein
MGSARGMPERNTPADLGCLIVRVEPKLGVFWSEVGEGLRVMDISNALFRLCTKAGGGGAVGKIGTVIFGNAPANGFVGTKNAISLCETK